MPKNVMKPLYDVNTGKKNGERLVREFTPIEVKEMRIKQNLIRILSLLEKKSVLQAEISRAELPSDNKTINAFKAELEAEINKARAALDVDIL